MSDLIKLSLINDMKKEIKRVEKREINK